MATPRYNDTQQISVTLASDMKKIGNKPGISLLFHTTVSPREVQNLMHIQQMYEGVLYIQNNEMSADAA